MDQYSANQSPTFSREEESYQPIDINLLQHPSHSQQFQVSFMPEPSLVQARPTFPPRPQAASHFEPREYSFQGYIKQDTGDLSGSYFENQEYHSWHGKLHNMLYH